MDYLPKDPAILVSSVNMLLRDEEFDNLESLCYAFSREPKEIKDYLLGKGFVWSEQQKQFLRPVGSKRQSRAQTHRLRWMITKDSIETAYSFLHQKRQVYIHSQLDWQKTAIKREQSQACLNSAEREQFRPKVKDDIEYAIASYVDEMSQELYAMIADGRDDFLREHSRFQEDITKAVEQLENML